MGFCENYLGAKSASWNDGRRGKVFTVPVEMRFRDLDAYGHVNNAVFFSYLETARVNLIHRELPDESHQIIFFVARARCEYKKPLTLRDRILVEMTVTRFRRAGFVLSYRVLDDDGTVYAMAETELACINPATGRPTAIPEWFVHSLSEPVPV
jgi:acyl-CoA thioester hydrolase